MVSEVSPLLDRIARHATPVVRLLTNWDAAALETSAITPAGAQAVVLLWDEFPDVDGGVPERLAPPLARALTSLGEVCFRVTGDVPSGTRLIGRIKAHRLTFAASWIVAGSNDPDGAIALFEDGWAQADQTAIIAVASDHRALQVVGTKQRAQLMLEEAEFLVAPVVDGAGMLIAARSVERLHLAISRIGRECHAVGINVQDG